MGLTDPKCYIMIFWSEIVLLSSIYLKTPKSSEKVPSNSLLKFVSQSIIGDSADCAERASRMRAMDLTDLCCYFSFVFYYFVPN